MAVHEFEPRKATLAHAAVAEQSALNGMSLVATLLADLANTVACGLVYVGDQFSAGDEVAVERLAALERIGDELHRANLIEWERPAEGDGDGDGIELPDALDALRAIAHHEEHMGSRPPDDEMRAIARRALGLKEGE